ncbi:hypothetical protein KKE03_02705 [Patescibacteria group bacterium]|nr:hypothetical protein [Patescibacteria group bacterium]
METVEKLKFKRKPLDGITIRGVLPSRDQNGVVTIVNYTGQNKSCLTKGIFLPQSVGAHIRDGWLSVPDPATTPERPLFDQRFSLPVLLNGGGEGGEILTKLNSWGIKVLSMGQIKRGNY